MASTHIRLMRVTYSPAKELVILEAVEYPLEELVKTSALIQDTGRPVILTWAEGIAFIHTPLPFNTKELFEERKKGRIYWASVFFSEMPQYRPVLKFGPRDIPVVATPNKLLKKVATWLAENRHKLHEGNLKLYS